MEHRIRIRRRPAAVVVGVLLAALPGTAHAHDDQPDGFGPPVNLETMTGTSGDLNTASLEGCPSESPDGLHLYFASNRPGGLGGVDIWMASRPHPDAPFGAPVNLGAPVNSAGDDFCPSATAGDWFLFVSTRTPSCGAADVYVTRPTWVEDTEAWAEPMHLGCHVNSPGVEMSPSLVGDPADGAAQLWFSSDRPGGSFPDGASPDHDLWVSRQTPFGFGPPEPADSLNTEANDQRPNLAPDGLEIVFDSNRPGGQGGTDVYIATRDCVDGPWTAPTNLAEVNSPANEVRPSLSWDGDTLYVGSNRPDSEPGADGQPSSDLYTATRPSTNRR
ncbi:MAG: hypothetical protein ACKVWR_00550 [Acidimicrobiales bacterium]